MEMSRHFNNPWLRLTSPDYLSHLAAHENTTLRGVSMESTITKRLKFSTQHATQDIVGGIAAGTVILFKFPVSSSENLYLSKSCQANADDCYDFCWHGHNNLISSGSGFSTLWQVTSSEVREISRFATERASLVCSDYMSDNVFAVASESGELRVWDFRINKKAPIMNSYTRESVKGMCIGHVNYRYALTGITLFQSNFLLLSSRNVPSIRMFDLRNMKSPAEPVREFLEHIEFPSMCEGYANLTLDTSSSNLFAVHDIESFGFSLVQFDLLSSKNTPCSAYATGFEQWDMGASVDFSPDGQFLLSSFNYDLDDINRAAVFRVGSRYPIGYLKCRSFRGEYDREITGVAWSRFDPCRIATICSCFNSDTDIWFWKEQFNSSSEDLLGQYSSVNQH